MTNVGWATLSVIPSFDGFGSKLERGTAGPLTAAGTSGGTRFGDAAGKSAGSRFGRVFSSVAKGALVGFAAGAAGAIKLAGDSISAASDLEESTNKVATIFGEADRKIFKFTETAADRLGQTNTAARDAAATFGTFGKAAGFADGKNAKFSKRMTRLASDLASFNNTEPDEAVMALGAALRGESEPIRKYGVLLDEATLKAEAMALGILEPVKNESQIKSAIVGIHTAQEGYNEAVKDHGKQSLEALDADAKLGAARDKLKKATEGTIPPLTQQQKLLAAQSQIFKQTSDAQGDFEKTSGSLANQQRRLKARFEDAKAELGKGLLPIMTEAADWALNEGLPKFEKFSRWFTKTGVPKLKAFGGEVKDLADDMKNLLGFLDDMPSWAKKTLIAGGAAAVVAKKTGVSDVLGSFRGATPATAMYVKVVGNPLDAGGGGGPMGWLGKIVKGGIFYGLGKELSNALPKGANPYGPEGFLDKAGLGRDDVTGTFNRLNDRWGFGETEKIEETKTALELVGEQLTTNKLAHDKFLSSVDKTPKQIDMQVVLKGYAEARARLLALQGVGAGGVPNVGADETPRGYGSTTIIVDKVVANSPKELSDEARRQSRNKARGGFGI